MVITLLPTNTLMILAMTTEIRPMNKNCPILVRSRLVKYPYKLMVPNNTAADINAIAILPKVNTAKIVAKLKPIRALNPANISSAISRGGLVAIANPIPITATKGANITSHLIQPVKKNFKRSGLVPTK
jgi:hypothetical protein